MSKEDFIVQMQKEASSLVKPEIMVKQYTKLKNNGIERIGLLLKKQECTANPIIYLEEFYEKHLEGTSVQELAKILVKTYEEVEEQGLFAGRENFSYSEVEDRIAYKLISKKKNEDLLKDVPYAEYLDLAIVFYVVLDDEVDGHANILISNQYLAAWKVTKEEIYETAKRNTPQMLPALIGQGVDGVYTLTNSKAQLGAAALLYPGIMEKAKKEIGRKFYIFPSSIHEVILTPDKRGMDPGKLKDMVKEINTIAVDPEDVLSDSVYYYDGKEIRIL